MQVASSWPAISMWPGGYLVCLVEGRKQPVWRRHVRRAKGDERRELRARLVRKLAKVSASHPAAYGMSHQLHGSLRSVLGAEGGEAGVEGLEVEGQRQLGRELAAPVLCRQRGGDQP